MKMKEMKVTKLERTIAQFNRQTISRVNIYSGRMLPGFHCDKVQYLPECSVKLLSGSVELGT